MSEATRRGEYQQLGNLLVHERENYLVETEAGYRMSKEEAFFFLERGQGGPHASMDLRLH